MESNAIEFSCEQCRTGLRVPGDNTTPYSRCPKCGKRIKVPVGRKQRANGKE